MTAYKFKIFLTENMYLSYVNDFLTVSACAQYYGVTESSMRRVINYYRSR